VSTPQRLALVATDPRTSRGSPKPNAGTRASAPVAQDQDEGLAFAPTSAINSRLHHLITSSPRCRNDSRSVAV